MSLVVPGPTTSPTLTAPFPGGRQTSQVMSRPIFIFLITLFLNIGTGNERLFSLSQSEQMPAGSPQTQGAWLARRASDRDTGRDSRMDVRMRLYDRQGRVRERAMTLTGLSGGPGQPVIGDRSLIKFTEPADIRGTGLLIWEQPEGDDERFLYLPSLGRVRRIAGSEAQESFAGSDFTYEDIGGREFDRYTYALLADAPEWTAADGARHATWRLESRSTDAGARFPRIVSLIRRDNFVVVQADVYNRRNEVQKTFAAGRVERLDTYWTVMTMTMSDLQSRTKTELIVDRAHYDVGLGVEAFTRRELERVPAIAERSPR